MISPDERSLIHRLVVGGGGEPLSDDEFLGRMGSRDGVQLGFDLLTDAWERRDADDIEYALVVCFRFGFVPRHLQLLVDLAHSDRHERHEDVASALADLNTPATIDALKHLATWVPEYLEFDDARALAVKAIWGLGAIPDARAREALVELSKSDNEIVATNATWQLQR